MGHTLNDLLERIDTGRRQSAGSLADAADELRTPLTLMTSELEWAAHRRRTPEQISEVIASLQVQVTRLVELANALLELEELRAVDSLRLEDVPVHDLLEDAIADALPRGTAVDVHAPETTAHVDRQWMTVAVANLLRNAHRYGQGDILVEATQTPSQLQVVVRDSGPGFPPEFRRHAFDRFSRAEVSRTTPGSGLGLYLVQSSPKPIKAPPRSSTDQEAPSV